MPQLIQKAGSQKESQHNHAGILTLLCAIPQSAELGHSCLGRGGRGGGGGHTPGNAISLSKEGLVITILSTAVHDQQAGIYAPCHIWCTSFSH